MRAVPNTIWRFGLFGKDDFHMDSNARVDSYDSTAGNYAAQATNGSGGDIYARANGHVGTNRDLSLDANASVHGNATPGPSHTATITGNAVVSGSTAPAATQVEMPALTVPTYTNYGNLTVNPSTTIAAGNAAYGLVTVRTNKRLTLTGPSTIVMSSLVLNSSADILVDSTNVPVTIYGLDNFIMHSNTTIHSINNKPADVRINLLSDNVASPEVTVQLDTVDFNSNSSITGIVFAPNARITFDSAFTLYGSYVVLDTNDILYGQGLKPANNIAGFVSSPGTKYKMHEYGWSQEVQPRLGATWAYNGIDTVWVSTARYNPAANSDARAASWDRNLVATINAYFDANGALIGDCASSSAAWRSQSASRCARSTSARCPKPTRGTSRRS